MLYSVYSEHFQSFVANAVAFDARMQRRHSKYLSREYLTLNYHIYG